MLTQWDKRLFTVPTTHFSRAAGAQVRSARSSETLYRSTLPQTCRGRARGVTATLHRNADRTPRLYVLNGGTGDPALQGEDSYDARGYLRCTFITIAAVNETHKEIRVYLSEDGTDLHQNERLKKSPGYPTPLATRISDPSDHFFSLCDS